MPPTAPVCEWHELREPASAPLPAPRRRIGAVLALFSVALAVVLGRAVQLELAYGDAFRDQAATTLVRQLPVPAARGAIRCRDGTLLADDRQATGLALDYRWLRDPPDLRWLASTARARLPKSHRSDARRLAEAQAALLGEREALHERLAKLARLSFDEWQARRARVQRRVAAIVAQVHKRRTGGNAGPVVVREEQQAHLLVSELPASAVAEVRRQPGDFPGVQLVEQRLRVYPAGTLAAHVVGHLGRAEGGSADSPRSGQMGIERAYEAHLSGRPGTLEQRTDRAGRVLTSWRSRQPEAGSDVVLTLNARLQETCEALLDAACRRRADRPAPSGGAIVVLDAHRGGVLALASWPRFDPNLFTVDDDGRLADVLADTSRPLFDRAVRMAISPGSVFKLVTAAALLQSAIVSPGETFDCAGYLHDPDSHRCQVFRHWGHGHGPITLADALAQSCNCYFFHYAQRCGPAPLVDWAQRFGLAQASGIELPDEPSGRVPTPSDVRRSRGSGWEDRHTLALAIGQGELQTTPLAIARLVAAIANGGKLVLPTIVAQPPDDAQPPIAIGLDEPTLRTLREGMRRAVADPRGTAFGAFDGAALSVAGKTGTAQTAEPDRDHAWFAGYLPADEPKLALVVVLEHGGNSSDTACPLARRLVEHIERLNLATP
jgi:penicillin-binding protein 2